MIQTVVDILCLLSFNLFNSKRSDLSRAPLDPTLLRDLLLHLLVTHVRKKVDFHVEWRRFQGIMRPYHSEVVPEDLVPPDGFFFRGLYLAVLGEELYILMLYISFIHIGFEK